MTSETFRANSRHHQKTGSAGGQRPVHGRDPFSERQVEIRSTSADAMGEQTWQCRAPLEHGLKAYVLYLFPFALRVIPRQVICDQDAGV